MSAARADPVAATEIAAANVTSSLFIWTPRRSEGDAGCDGPVVASHRRVGDGELIADTEDRVDPAAEVESAKDDSRRKQELTKVGMRAERPVCVIELELRPEILTIVILQSEISENRIAEGRERCRRTDGGDRVLLAHRPLEVEVAEAHAEGQRWLDDVDIVRNGVGTGRLRGLEKGSDDIVAVPLVGAHDAVLEERGRIVAPPGHIFARGSSD